jgi:hypothetical protein
MQSISTTGLDIAKLVFQVHGVDAAGQVVVCRQLRRRYVLAFFQKLPPFLVGIEACASSHHWSRELKAFGFSAFPTAGGVSCIETGQTGLVTPLSQVSVPVTALVVSGCSAKSVHFFGAARCDIAFFALAHAINRRVKVPTGPRGATHKQRTPLCCGATIYVAACLTEVYSSESLLRIGLGWSAKEIQ